MMSINIFMIITHTPNSVKENGKINYSVSY